MPARTLSVVITANIRGLRSGLGQASASVRTFGNDVRTLGVNTKAHTDMIGRGFLGAGAVMIGALGASAFAAIRFEQAMRNVTTISSYAARNFDEVSNKAREMSTRLPQSATELAEGMYQVASSGFAARDSLVQVTEAAATAASAGLASTEEAATGLTGIMNAYGLSASKAREVSDLMFQTVNLGVVTFGELAHEIGGVVGTAAAASVDFESVGAALATITRAGIPAAEATTSLNRVLQNIISPSEAMAETLTKLGYSSGQAAIESDGFEQVMKRLVGTTHGNIAALDELFPDIRGLRGALALTANEGKTWETVLKGMGIATDGAGATARALKEQSKSLGFQLGITKNRIIDAAIGVGQALMPALRLVNSVLSKVIEGFQALPGPVRTGIVILTALGGILLTVGGAFLLLAGKVARAKLALQEMGPAGQKIGAMTSTLGRVAGRMAIVATAAVGLVTSFEMIGDSATGSVIGIGGMIASGAALGSMFGTWGAPIGAAIGGIVGLGKALFGGGESADDFAARIDRLSGKIEGLGKKAAFVAFLEQLPDDMDKAAFAWGRMTEGIEKDLRALGQRSPAQLAKLVRAMKSLRDETGKPLTNRREAAALDRMVEKSARAFARQAQEKKKSAKADGELAEGGRKAKQIIAQLGNAADGATEDVVGLTEAQKELQKEIRDFLNPMDAWGRATEIATERAEKSFGDLKGKVIPSLTDFTNALRGQNLTLIGWEQNLITVGERGGDEFRRQLQNLGPEAAGMVAQIAASTGPEFEAVREQFATSADLASTGAVQAFDEGLATAGQIASERGAAAGTSLQAGFDSTMPSAVETLKGHVSKLKKELNSIRAANVAISVTWHAGATPVPPKDEKDGGIIRFFADGGHYAQIVPAGTYRVFGEDETGGEAYIPLANAKRARSMGILREVASIFGQDVIPRGARRFAYGGITGRGIERGTRMGTTVIVNTNITYAAPIYGNDGVKAAARAVVDARDAALATKLRARR